MRRFFAWLAGFVGGAAAYRAFKRSPQPALPAPDPAAELKAKLAEARAAAEDRPAAQAAETAVDEAADPDVDARRRSVHEQGRAAIDEMRSE